ncbi:MAG: serine/threonine-protein phosphatase [Chlamydiae bacterium]|nr:serine/threonine-protein phosphatase [Chlamydiota bacterium]
MSVEHDTDSRIRMKGSLAMRVFITSCAFLVIPLIFYTAFTYKSEYDRAYNQVYESLNLSLGDHLKFVTEITDLQAHFLDALYEIVANRQVDNLNFSLSKFVNDEAISTILYLKVDPNGLICFASSVSSLVGKNFSGEIDLKKINTLDRKSFIARDSDGNYVLYLIRLIKDLKSQDIKGAVALSTSMSLLLKEITGFGTIGSLETTILSSGGDVLASTHKGWGKKTLLVRSVENINLNQATPQIYGPDLINLEPTELGYQFTQNDDTRLIVLKPAGQLPIMIGLDVPKKIFTDKLKGYFTTVGSLFLFILVLGGGATYLLTLRISKPLSALCGVMQMGEEGHLETRFDFDKWGFEVNYVGYLYNRLMDKIQLMIQEIRTERSEKERYATQMLLALEIQKSLLPTKIQIPNIKIASSYFPAIDVAGDIFDYFEISPGRVLLMCSDVAGKGIQACLYSLGFRGFVRSVSVFEKNLDKIVSQVNDLYLKDTAENCMFVTAWIGILDTTSKTLEYVSCGHPPALLRRHDLPVELLEGEGIPFGILKMDEIKVQKVQLKSKDLVIAYTDGVTEAMNDAKQLYGMDRLITAIRNIDVASPENLIEDLYRRIKEFSSKEQSDDITILAMEIE